MVHAIGVCWQCAFVVTSRSGCLRPALVAVLCGACQWLVQVAWATSGGWWRGLWAGVCSVRMQLLGVVHARCVCQQYVLMVTFRSRCVRPSLVAACSGVRWGCVLVAGGHLRMWCACASALCVWWVPLTWWVHAGVSGGVWRSVGSFVFGRVCAGAVGLLHASVSRRPRGRHWCV